MATKSELWQELKAAGRLPGDTFVKIRKEELEALVAELREINAESPPAPPTFMEVMGETQPEPTPFRPEDFPYNAPQPRLPNGQPRFQMVTIPFSDKPLVTQPGETRITHTFGEPIRRDSSGRVWIQDEFLKPLTAKPRGRRLKKYTDTGVVKKTFKGADGYTEEIEVPGTLQVQAEARVTLPSYQVGTYWHPAYLFKVHCYGGREGFDRHDVERFYGGPEQVPSSCNKRIYISNVMCYDMRLVIQAINDEYREIKLEAAREIR